MLYLVSFAICVICLFYLVNVGATQRVSILLFGAILAIGNGGYYALSEATSLEEAILANKLFYLIGCFAPMLLFIILCEICQKPLKPRVLAIMSGIQGIIYLSACTVGVCPAFYKKVSFSIGKSGGFLIKEYGIMHTVYAASLAIYVLLCLVFSLINISKKNVVNPVKIDIILAVLMISGVLYMVERFVKFDVELLPMLFSVGFLVVMGPMIKINEYSVLGNHGLINEKLGSSAFIIFDKKLRYRGCNDYARELYPELNFWELEKKIPGNGGRFNTYLRQPLLSFVRDENKKEGVSGTFSTKDHYFEYFNRIMKSNSGKKVGYVIEVRNISDYVKKDKEGAQE